MNTELIAEAARVFAQIARLEDKLRTLVFDSDEHCEVSANCDYLWEIIGLSSADMTEEEYRKAKRDALSCPGVEQ